MNATDLTPTLSYLTSAATIVQIQKWLKTTEAYRRFVAAFPGADKWAHWVAAGIMSLCAAAGIHYVWSGSLITGGVLTVQIPAAAILLHGVSDWFKVYIMQHTIYESMRRSDPPPPTYSVHVQHQPFTAGPPPFTAGTITTGTITTGPIEPFAGFKEPK